MDDSIDIQQMDKRITAKDFILKPLPYHYELNFASNRPPHFLRNHLLKVTVIQHTQPDDTERNGRQKQKRAV